MLELLQKCSSGIGTFIQISVWHDRLELKNLFVRLFFSFSQNSFELSSKYDTFCHLSPLSYETFTAKFLLGFHVHSSFGMFAAAAGAPSTIYFNYFHIAYIHFLGTPRKETPRKSHTASIYLLSNPHTHEQFPHLLEKTELCKTIAREKRTQIIIVVTNERSWSKHFVTWHSPLNI